MEGHAHQSHRRGGPGLHIRFAVNDIEKFLHLTAVASFWNDDDPPHLLHHEEAARTVRRLGHPDRAIQRQGGEGGAELHLGQGLSRNRERRPGEQAQQEKDQRALLWHT